MLIFAFTFAVDTETGIFRSTQDDEAKYQLSADDFQREPGRQAGADARQRDADELPGPQAAQARSQQHAEEEPADNVPVPLAVGDDGGQAGEQLRGVPRGAAAEDDPKREPRRGPNEVPAEEDDDEHREGRDRADHADEGHVTVFSLKLFCCITFHYQ